jgi:cytochrome c556
MKRIATAGAILLSSLASISAGMAAQPPSPQELAAQAVATRQAVYKLLAFSNATLRPGATFDLDTAKANVARISMLAKMIPEVFAADTTAFSGLTTRANDSVWKDKADFTKLAADLDAAAQNALNTLNTKGADGAREVAGAIGQKCGACHDKYRHD